MKKLYLLTMTFILLSLPVRIFAAIPTDDKIVLSDLTYQSSSGLYYFDVSLQGSRIYAAYNMDIYFPDGISVAKNSNDTYRVQRMTAASTLLYPYTISYEEDDEGNEVEVKTYSHQIFSSMPASNWLRVACASMENQEFIATSGKMFRVFVTISDSWATSFCPKPIVKVSGIALTTKQEEEYDPADFTCRPFSRGIPTDRTLPLNISANNKFGTLCLPFSHAVPEGVNAYSCESIEGDLLILSPAETFEACTPYILYAVNGYSGSLQGTVDMAYEYPLTDDNYTNGELTGVLTRSVVNTGYIMQNKGNGPMFYDAEGSNFSLSAGRCYLTPTTAGAKVLGFKFEDTTGIKDVMQEPTTTDDAYYDLSGRRVVNPGKGIYIRNNSKIIIK